MTMKSKAVERKGSLRLDPDDFPRLTRNEFEQARDLFRKYDINNSGHIKKPDLLDSMKGTFEFKLFGKWKRYGQLYA